MSGPENPEEGTFEDDAALLEADTSATVAQADDVVAHAPTDSSGLQDQINQAEGKNDRVVVPPPKDSEPDTVREIGGIKLRGLSLGSVQMLRRTKNRLVEGIEFNDPLELLDDIFEFLYMHSAPEDEVVDYSFWELTERMKHVTKWASKVQAHDVQELVDATMDAISEDLATQVRAEPPSSMKKEKAEAQAQSGNG